MMDSSSSRGPDVTVLASSPIPSKGRWVCKLHTASARAYVRTYLKGIQLVPGSDPKAPGLLEGDLLYLNDALLVKIFLDALKGYGPVIVDSKNPLIQSGPWMVPIQRSR